MKPVDIVKKVYEYFALGDMDSLAALFADKIVWIINGDLPYSGCYDNFPEVREKCFGTLKKYWPTAVWTPNKYYSCDANIFAQGHLVIGNMKTEFLTIYKIEDDKIVYFHAFDDTDMLRRTMHS